LPWIGLLLAVAIATLLLPRLVLLHRYEAEIVEPDDAPARPTAIVFGAGLRRDGNPTQVLADRVSAAAHLYRQGTVQSLLLSGSTRGPTYDEAEAMRTLAIHLGVEPEAILVDRQGTRTRETCLRARQAFGIRSALLVTQRFHLPRAMVLCNAMGMKTTGVEADLTRYSALSRSVWELRELPASLVALVDAARLRSEAGRIDQATAGLGPGANDGT
jgi:SanA protein